MSSAKVVTSVEEISRGSANQDCSIGGREDAVTGRAFRAFPPTPAAGSPSTSPYTPDVLDHLGIVLASFSPHMDEVHSKNPLHRELENAVKSAVLFAAFIVSCLLLSSCGDAGQPQGSLTHGNWSFTGTSSAIQGQILRMGGTLIQTGASVPGNMTILSAVDCLSPLGTATFSGSFSGDTLTLTSVAMNGEVITLNLTGTGNLLTGTYTVTGGPSSCDDKGTVTAIPIPPITGNWSGVLQNPDGSTVPVSVAATLTQAAFTAGGFSPLSGTVTVQDNPPLPFFSVTLPISTSGASISAVTGDGVAIYANGFSYNGLFIYPNTATEVGGILRWSGDTKILTLTKQ